VAVLILLNRNDTNNGMPIPTLVLVVLNSNYIRTNSGMPIPTSVLISLNWNGGVLL